MTLALLAKNAEDLKKMSLGKTIARLRMERGWRQADLADQLGVHASHVARWETDRVRPRKKPIGRLAEIFGVPVEELEAADQRDVASRILEEEDPGLLELLRQVHRLNEPEREVLRTFLETILMRADLQDMVQRRSRVNRPAVASKAGRRGKASSAAS